MLAKRRVYGHKNVHRDRVSLPYPVNPVVTLLFNRWIPPAGEVKNMGSRSQR